MKPLFIDGMRGLGDNIFQRAFVKTLTKSWDVYLATPWPELYEDLPVEFVYQPTILRTQAKNIKRQQRQWHDKPKAPTLQPHYRSTELAQGLFKSMERKCGVEPSPMDLPAFTNIIEAPKPICVVRPATLRKEWFAGSRNPDPAYIARAVERIRDDFYVVSVADLKENEETALHPLPCADLTLHGGELDVRALLGLIQAASLVIGGVGWIVPACIAAQTPLFCILGGNGGANAPERITDSRMNLEKIGFAKPDSFCYCANMRHQCDKRISNFDQQFEAYLDRISTILH